MLNQEELTQLEFNAYKLIQSFVSGNYHLFKISKTENGFDLKSESNHFKIIEEDLKYYLVVINGGKEYLFDGKNVNPPFSNQRNYNGEWQILFENILENKKSNPN